MKLIIIASMGLGIWAQGSILVESLNSEQRELVEKISQLPLSDQVEAIKKKVNVKLLKSHNPIANSKYESIGKPEQSIDDVKDLEGLYGKVQCDEKPTIFIAEDAPPSTLIHEFIHFLQIKNDETWCELDGRILDKDEKRHRAMIFHHFEYEAFKILWLLKETDTFTFEDRMLAIEGLDRENKILKALNEKTLTDTQSESLAQDIDGLHSEITMLTWKNKSHKEAGAVLQKMEILALKSCVENEKTGNEDERINSCIKLRCGQSGYACQKITAKEIKSSGSNLTQRIIYSWLKPNQVPECTTARMTSEFQDGARAPSPCWVKWYSRNSRTKSTLNPVLTRFQQKYRDWDLPPLPIDKKITMLQSTGIKSYINSAYCYYVFQNTRSSGDEPIESFGFTNTGTSILASKLERYQFWLTHQTSGKNCSKLVEVFTEQLPSKLDFEVGSKYILIVNPVAVAGHGPKQFAANMVAALNHERLHLIFDHDKTVQNRIQKEWGSLNDEIRKQFSGQHGVGLREYFSMTRQRNPKKLF